MMWLTSNHGDFTRPTTQCGIFYVLLLCLLHEHLIFYFLKPMPSFVSPFNNRCVFLCGKWCMLDHDEVEKVVGLSSDSTHTGNGPKLEQHSPVNGHLGSEMG